MKLNYHLRHYIAETYGYDSKEYQYDSTFAEYGVDFSTWLESGMYQISVNNFVNNFWDAASQEQKWALVKVCQDSLRAKIKSYNQSINELNTLGSQLKNNFKKS